MMAFDHGLVERIRDALLRIDERGVREKNVFGGRGFLVGRSAFVIAGSRGLIVKVAPDEYDAVLSLAGVGPFTPGGSAMSTWVVANDDATADDDDLIEWLRRGLRGVSVRPSKRRG